MNILTLAALALALVITLWLIYRRRSKHNPKAVAGDAARVPEFTRAEEQRPGSLGLIEEVSRRIGPVSIEALRKLIPLRTMSDEELTAVASDYPPQRYAAGVVVFREGEATERIFCLLDGILCLENRRGDRQVIYGDSPRAQKPLNGGSRYTATARAQTDISVIGFTPELIKKVAHIHEPVQRHGLDLRQLPVPERLADSSLFYVFRRTFEEDKLQLPTLPTVALKLRKAINEDVNNEEAAKIVQTDAVIASKLIQVANCPLYLTGNPATTCQSAITRLGLTTTRNIIFTISMRHMFHGTRSQSRRLMEMWKQSVYVSVLASVLAKKTRRIDSDKALLGGLIYKIGAIPFLHFAEDLPPHSYTDEEVEAAIEVVQGPVGQHLLRSWDFPAEYADLPLLAEDWQHDSGIDLDLADIVRLAVWHSYVGTPTMAALPPITALPAYAKLGDGSLSPESSLQLLHDAKDLINETYRIFH